MDYKEYYNKCTLCPRMCKAKRTKGKTGVCGETDVLRASRAALHMWEEPCISGEEGSGTVFFTGCNLRCVFCQNFKIARSMVGKEITPERLAEIFLELQEKKANNINLVTPTHFVPHIVYALQMAKEKGLHIPVVYNTSGYEKVETLRMLEGLVDIYLPDFKYLDSGNAGLYSNAPDYPAVALEALKEMVRQVGEPAFDERGMMTKGVIVRHLVLPGALEDSKHIINYLYRAYGDKIYMSIMSQYTPLDTLDKEKYPRLAKKLQPKAYEMLVDFAIDLGVEQAFIQDGDVAEESFIPSFEFEGL